ncbi:MAG: heme-copper oxidase subunit III [Magnetococcales bacterium]|nr:heme-copper oxidase subunit III [Magnetococcales bacterium]NGZ06905.1 heme-copper oxidase subunit III [Magnetococcales bacterium]
MANTASAHGHAHAHHWETSVAPLLIVIGVLFLVVFGFLSWFSYNNILWTQICAGIGTPLLLAGIAKWTAEALTQKPVVEGLTPIALPLFIVSEVFIFLGLFTSYWTMRLSAGDNWPPAGTPTDMNLILPIIMTVILVTSSFTYHVAEEKLAKNDIGGVRLWVFISIVLGAIFLGCTVYEYQHLFHMNFKPSTNAYSTAFYSITGFHASHVLVGLGAFLTVLIAALAGKTNKYLTFCVGLYWHFVDVVWFFVVSQVYYW